MVTLTNDTTRDLCLALMKADTEEAVIKLLTDAGFWNEPTAWRYYGDCESNFSTIYNQASRSDAATICSLSSLDRDSNTICGTGRFSCSSTSRRCR